MTGPRIGSLFSGYGGLDAGVQAAIGGELAWHCEIEPAAVRLLDHHHPDVPNLGDITAVDWPNVAPVDVLTGGFPCQDVSSAGRRAGMRPNNRSGLWAHMARAINVLRPELVVIENVRGLLSAEAACDVEPCPWCLGDQRERPLRALGAVLGDLAVLGYDARWHGVRASDAGAPHARFRVFIVARPAQDTDGAAGGEWRVAAPGQAAGGRARADAGRPGGAPAADAERDGRAGRDSCGTGAPNEQGAGSRPATAGHGPVVADSDRGGHSEVAAGADELDGERPPQRRGTVELTGAGRARLARDGATAGEPAGRRRTPAIDTGDGAPPAPDAVHDGREGREERDQRAPGGQRAPLGDDAAGRVLDWADYGPAIRRWELTIGRPAPTPTGTGARGGQVLSPLFVEWLMGLPSGHVTDVPGLSRSEQLKLLGNGVVPQQAELAVRHMLAADVAERVA